MSKKKVFRVFLWIMGGFVAVISLVGFISVIVLFIKSVLFGFDKVKDSWSVLNSSFAIFSATGTLLAVIVALFKEGISSLLFSPDFKAEVAQPTLCVQKSQNNNSLIEKYYTRIRVYNSGTLDAKNCRIDITSIEYDKNRKANKKKKINPSSQAPLSLNNNLISKGDYIEIPVFEVSNPSAAATPGTIPRLEKATIQFSGLELSEENSYCGLYIVRYRLSCDSGFSESFEMRVDWAGEWSDDLNEMADKFEVSIE